MDWSNVPVGPEDAIYKITRLYKECNDPHKVSLGVGAYRDENGNPLVLEAVTRAKAELASLPPNEWIHEYQPITGHAGFVEAAQELAFGPNLKEELGDRLISLQSLSGTGACRLGFEFIARFGTPGNDSILVPNPTWGNHKSIAKFAKLKVMEYRYLDEMKKSTPALDLDGMLQDLRNAPMGTAVVLHMCAHNPTGVDPTIDEWSQIADVIAERNLQPLFDNAYQGFASGDLENDAAPLRLFVERGLNPLVACSFAKNMGLYGERVGALHVVTPDASSAKAALTQLKIQARAMYSNPPRFGAEVAYKVLTNPELRALWIDELKRMSARIRSMRMALRMKLENKLGADESSKGKNAMAKGAAGVSSRTWSHITDQIGMFSYTGLSREQVKHCAEHGNVFMLETGRISMAGLNEGNVEHVATAMANAIRACPEESVIEGVGLLQKCAVPAQ